MTKNEVMKLSKDDLIRAVSTESNTPLYVVTKVLNSLEVVVMDNLKKANKDSDVSIRLLEGIYVDGVYLPSRTRINNLTGRSVDISERIKVKPRSTKVYESKINE